MNKPVPIIEYQEYRQRTPQELIDFLQAELDAGNITHMFVYYKDEEKHLQAYAPAAIDRKYYRSMILWDIMGWVSRYRFAD